MSNLKSRIENLKREIEGGLIVSCQAPSNSPLAKPEIVAAFAQTAEQNGAVAVRIDSPVNIAAVRKAVKIPIIGIYKIVNPATEVYITPTYQSAIEVAEAGADIIAFDATLRPRSDGEKLTELREKIKNDLRLPVMADIATFEEGNFAAENLGCEFVGTTLSGYTKETAHRLAEPDFQLVKELAADSNVRIIAEGRLTTPENVKTAFECGAFAVVVGNAITGLDCQIRKFVKACRPQSGRVIV